MTKFGLLIESTQPPVGARSGCRERAKIDFDPGTWDVRNVAVIGLRTVGRLSLAWFACLVQRIDFT